MFQQIDTYIGTIFDRIIALKLTIYFKIVIAIYSYNVFLYNISKENSSIPQIKRYSQILYMQGLRPHHPVILVPGIVSTGLEVWKGVDCTEGLFREKIWGGILMLKTLLFSPRCWLKHMTLNTSTGLDPYDVKLRPVSGLHAADYFLGPYWVWGKLIKALSDIGYDSNSMYFAAYDWRLALSDLEKRDHYFSWLKLHIETLHKIYDTGTVLVSHSMGGIVVHHFLKWVESSKGGNGGTNWVNDHISHIINLGAPLLGAPKLISTILSGEMKDTAELSPILQTFKETVFTKAEFASFFRATRSAFSMWPKGGSAIWGDLPYIKFSSGDDLIYNQSMELTLNDINILLSKVDPIYASIISDIYSITATNDYDLSSSIYDDSKYWSNPLESSLPAAPSLTIWSFYGIGKPTEFCYQYKLNPYNVTNGASVPFIIDTSYFADYNNISYRYGITNGDGTVPIFSLAYLPAVGWKNAKYNPAGVSSKIREYKSISSLEDNDNTSPSIPEYSGMVSGFYDEFSRLIADWLSSLPTYDLSIETIVDTFFRGGSYSIDHIDLLGNQELISDILKIVGHHANITKPDNRIYTDHENLFLNRHIPI